MSVRDKTALESLISTNLANNTSFAITPTLLREVIDDLLDSLHGVYGGLYITAGATAQNLTTTPAKLTLFAADFTALGTTPAHASDQIAVGTAGVYKVEGSFSFSGVADVKYTLALRGGVAGATLITGVKCSYEPADTDVHHMGFVGLVMCAASDILTVYGESDEATNQAFTLTEAQLIAHRIA